MIVAEEHAQLFILNTFKSGLASATGTHLEIAFMQFRQAIVRKL